MLTRFLQSKTEQSYSLLRVASGLLFSFHGVQKIFGVLTEAPPAFGTQIWVGGVIELVAGLAIAIGLFTTWAAFLSSGTMAVAYTQFHWKLALGTSLLPGVNGGELALVYAFLFLFVACRGAGIHSVDRARAGS
jgi:putative oxidoreductase